MTPATDLQSWRYVAVMSRLRAVGAGGRIAKEVIDGEH